MKVTKSHSFSPVAWQSSELILEHVPAEAVLAYWTLEKLCEATSAELDDFCVDDGKWEEANWALSRDAPAEDIAAWSHWYDLHNFVNGKGDRPSWLPM